MEAFPQQKYEFRNIGLFNGKELNDSGRAVISGSLEDIGKFKTQSLRNIAITAPYMHNVNVQDTGRGNRIL